MAILERLPTFNALDVHPFIHGLNRDHMAKYRLTESLIHESWIQLKQKRKEKKEKEKKKYFVNANNTNG